MWAGRWDSASSAERGLQNHRAVLPEGGASGTSGSVTNAPKTWGSRSLSLSVCGSGIWAQPSRISCFRVPHRL